MDTPLLLPIAKITDENSSVKTFWFDYNLQCEPGQFVMVWIPGVDQKPFSIAYDDGKKFGLSIFAVGPLSSNLFSMKPGDKVGITGPYGKPFSIKPDTHYITVGGGYGAGPLGILVERMAEHNCTVDFLVGARNKDLLLFVDRVKDLPYVNVQISTDDGSAGHHGYVTDLLKKTLTNQQTNKLIHVSTCGPELMEKKVLDICNQYEVDCELSIERYMKCGYSICGQCCVDDSGITMCVDGPVVDRETANQIKEFGKYHRDKSGTKKTY
jgi:dihydroorotate dehydrogenase electron transfer subunit